jgi:uncharacterized membrane protein
VTVTTRATHELGPMPTDRAMSIVDERIVHAPLREIFARARDVEHWPLHLKHYRAVRFRERWEGGGIVEMAAWRPFGPLTWPTWWLSTMHVDEVRPAVRFRHIAGITKGMEVEWSFAPAADGTRVRIVHAWDGPPWPLIGRVVARAVIGPVFVHGIASRTLAGLGSVAECAMRIPGDAR